jgi:tetratricopeptide (TPR) repeat protein
VLKLIAVVLMLMVSASVAFAGATQDCANRTLSPRRITWACTVVIEANPKAVFAYVARADASSPVSTDNFTALLADYSKAIELDPTLVAAYLGRARVNFHGGRFKSMLGGFDEAANNATILADYDRAVALEPENVSARTHRAFHQMITDKPALALADYDIVVRLKPDDDDSYTGRAWAHFELGHYAESIADYDKGFYLGTKRSAYHEAQRGLAHSLNGDDVLAIKDYDSALKFEGIGPDVALNRAFSLYSLGRYEDASKALMAERETVSDISWKLLRFHAMSHTKLHQDPAFNAVQDATTHNEWYKPLAELHWKGKDAGAVVAAMEQQPAKNQCIAFFFAGQWQIAQKRLQDAKVMLQKAIDVCPRTAVELAAARAALKKL